MTRFFEQAKIIGSDCTISDLDRCFIAATYKLQSHAFDIPGHMLCRFMFMEILVRLAEIKFIRNGTIKTFADALEKLFLEHCFLHYKLPPWQTWREEVLWTNEVNKVFQSNLKSIDEVHFRIN